MSVSQRGLKNKIAALIKEQPLDGLLTHIEQYPADKLINALFAGICHADQTIKWHSVVAMGITVARLADQDMEAGRVVMRRFMWSLNDESGGIGWGAPEAMAECLARHRGLADEFTNILVSYMREDGFYLEMLAHHQGLMWAVGRLALVRPELLHKWQAGLYLLPYLDSEDLVVRALAARALGILMVKEATPGIEPLTKSQGTFLFFDGAKIVPVSVAHVAQEALDSLNRC